MKQTAVEWLESMVIGMIQNGADFGEDYPALIKHIEQAKQMEREQTIWFAEDFFGSFIVDNKSTEEYYNETYKK